MSILIQSIIGVSLAPIAIYAFSILCEIFSDISINVHCTFIDVKDSIKRIKYNLKK